MQGEAAKAPDDTALVRLAANGDEEAFHVLMRRYAPLLKSLAAQYGGVGSDLEDLIQEGTLGLLSAIRGYRPEAGGFAAFAAACVRNRMLSAVRRTRAAELHETPEETVSVIPSGQADPAQMVLRHEEMRLLREQLSRSLTPLEYRVLMRYLDGQSYKEIAAAAGVSEKAVDNALQRVRQKLSADGSR